ncbi:T6SS immunity protein Tli4 family protein [Paraburkholderia steynii]|nr:T6SS immunity protein Tli4 family protein [Paraburkholderia steynii]
MKHPIGHTLALAILWLTLFGQVSHARNNQENATMNEPNELRTQCVGRYLIDIPHSSVVFGSAKVTGVSIDSVAMSYESFRQEMTSRQATMTTTKSRFGYKFLYEIGEVPGIKNSKYFVSLGDADAPSDATRVIEAFKWDRGYLIKARINASDFTKSKYATPEILQVMSIKADVAPKLRTVFDLIEKMRGRPDDVIPTEPGMCFVGGFLPGNAGDVGENPSVQFVLSNNRDVSVGFDTNAGIREAETLLQRSSVIHQGLQQISGARTIRKGGVDLVNGRAEEWLISGKTPLNVIGNTFTLEANSTTSSALSPLLTLDMETGTTNAFFNGPLKSPSLSETDAITLWDAISRSVRARPDGF